MLHSFATFSAMLSTSAEPTPASTPFASQASPAIAASSPAFPRIAVNWISANNSCTTLRRYEVAPTPTGSSTTGVPATFAARPAIFIAVTSSPSSVPILITSTSAIFASSSISSFAEAIIGDAPIASNPFAESFATTIFVILCTNGPFSHTFSNVIKSNIIHTPTPILFFISHIKKCPFHFHTNLKSLLHEGKLPRIRHTRRLFHQPLLLQHHFLIIFIHITIQQLLIKWLRTPRPFVHFPHIRIKRITWQKRRNRYPKTAKICHPVKVRSIMISSWRWFALGKITLR
ncbi:hydroxyethylthiazole kinase [Listeria monocytogenes]|nr:hydroxyethylthiazole kinase [Listeria monocytogenes]GAM95150.1 hydroxyethylthiazole kinase [Listeria monocytogenes]